MLKEKQWVQSLQSRLQASLLESGGDDRRVKVMAGKQLAYANEIIRYDADGRASSRPSGYETDILLCDVLNNGDWIPRVVIECKLGSVTTHDALTYSTKASTHKHVHPYLRYGILIGAFDTAVPGRLVRHGAYFDFMMVWQNAEPTEDEWTDLRQMVADELQASRALQELLDESRLRSRKRFRLLHRPLRLR